ncbi:MAG TPA: hypothetical protein DCM71_06005, partial [Runella sp.]|nr:hypothetical protein [Runella sp.]
DNGDFKKVFATVFQVLSTFLENHPLAIVVFYGSSLARTRLYQIAISRELEQLEERFVVKGLANFIFEPFVKNKPYEAFSFSLKKM